MKDPYDIGPTLAEIDTALLAQCMHITTTSRHDMRKALTGFVAARQAAAELASAATAPSKVCPACNGSKYSNRPWINLQNPGAAPPACMDCKTCGATGRVPDAVRQAQPAADLTDDEIDEIGVDFGGDYRVLRQFARAVLAVKKGKQITPGVG